MKLQFLVHFQEKYPIQNYTDIELKLSYSDLLPTTGKYNIIYRLKLMQENAKDSLFSND
jgi:hypothetical protein